MITLIAILLLLAGIGIFIINSYNKKAEKYNSEVSQDYNKKDIIPINFSNGRGYLMISLSILMLFFSVVNPIGRNSFGYRQVVEDPTSGKTWVQFDQGWYFKGFFSKTYEYPNVLTVMFTDGEMEEEITALDSSFVIRFNDATKAEAEATVRWRLPDDDASMLEIHKEYHSPTKLAATTLTKYTRECLRYSAQLMESTGSLI